MNDRRKFTPEEGRQLADLIKNGTTLDEVKTHFRCSRVVLHREMQRLKIKPLRKLKVKFTPEELEKILTAARNGESSTWVADALGRGRAAVICAARRHGVPFVDPRRLKYLHEGKQYVRDVNPFTVDPEKFAAFIEAGKAERARGR